MNPFYLAFTYVEIVDYLASEFLRSNYFYRHDGFEQLRLRLSAPFLKGCCCRHFKSQLTCGLLLECTPDERNLYIHHGIPCDNPTFQ